MRIYWFSNFPSALMWNELCHSWQKIQPNYSLGDKKKTQNKCFKKYFGGVKRMLMRHLIKLYKEVENKINTQGQLKCLKRCRKKILSFQSGTMKLGRKNPIRGEHGNQTEEAGLLLNDYQKNSDNSYYFIKTNYGARKRFTRQSASLGKTLPCKVCGQYLLFPL